MEGECILILPPGRSADFPVRSNVERRDGFRRLLEQWGVRGLLRTGKSALRWRCQDTQMGWRTNSLSVRRMKRGRDRLSVRGEVLHSDLKIVQGSRDSARIH